MLDTGLSTRCGTAVDTTGPTGAIRVSEADLRAFYDPADRSHSRSVQDLLDRVAATRAPSVLTGTGRLTGHEVILAEALHACLAVDDRAGVPLPVAPERQRSIARAVDRHADTVAGAVTELADDLERRSRRLLLRGPHRVTAPDRLVFAGRVLAAVAHDGVVRRNGRAYYSHPDEVAAIVTAAWHPRARRAPDPRLEITRFMAYCHDTFEDNLDPVGGYLNRPVVVSPRVVLAVLRRLGIPDGVGIARVLLLMTRTSASDGRRMPYLDHVDRGIREGGSLFVLTKAADIHHNLDLEPEHADPHDPRASARHRKRELYRLAAARLREAADGYDPGTARTIHRSFTIRRRDLPSSRTGSVCLEELAASVRHRVTAALA